MTSGTGTQTITITIYPDISKVITIRQCKTWVIFFFKKHAEIKARKLVPDPSFSFEKASCEVKTSG